MLKSGASAAYIAAQDEAGKAADALMRRAVLTVQRQIVYRAETGEKEIKTLADREAGPFRLACMTKVSGPVVVEVVE